MPTFVQHRLAALIRAFAPAITSVGMVSVFWCPQCGQVRIDSV